eukprot:4722759-Prymnesium_polylepis.1
MSSNPPARSPVALSTHELPASSSRRLLHLRHADRTRAHPRCGQSDSVSLIEGGGLRLSCFMDPVDEKKFMAGWNGTWNT